MKLSQDSYQLHNALTGFMSVIFLNLSTITVSLAFAFTFSWKLTLILLVFSPLMAAKGAIQSSVMKRMSKKSDEI
jgi:ABC-type bacteriocin/lantibiotic exporter with double-glycine peptidase domain